MLPVVAVAASGLSLYAFALGQGGFRPLLSLAFLTALATLAELFPAPFAGVSAGTTSFSTVFVASAAALYGWSSACVVACTAMLVSEVEKRQPSYKLLFNAGTYALAGAAAGLASEQIPANERLGLLAAVVVWIVNIALLSWVVSAVSGEQLVVVAARFYRSSFWPAVVICSIVVVLVRLWRVAPLWSLGVLPPIALMVIYQRRLAGEEERRRELDRIRDDFVATASHELRTPIASVYGSAMTMKERQLDPQTTAQLLDVIARESERLSSLAEDILATTSVPRLLRSDTTVFDVAPLVHEVADSVGRATNGDVAVSVEVADGTRVAAKEDLLRRVLTNLLENSVKYSPHGGRITVSAQADASTVLFSVADEGIGIPAADRERVFDRFTRVDAQMVRGVGGTGLGLYICKQLVEGMSGEIWVADSARGTTMKFRLPTGSQVV